MSNHESARVRIRAWVCETSGAAPASLTDQTPIFGNGFLKSINLLDLILLIEEIADQEIDVEKLGPKQFRDIDTIVATFFSSEECAA